MNYYERNVNSFLSSVISSMSAVYLPAYFISLIELLEDFYKFDVLSNNDHIHLQKNTLKFSYELIASYFLSYLLRIRKEIPTIKMSPSSGKSHEERFIEDSNDITNNLMRPIDLLMSNTFKEKGQRIIYDMKKDQNIIKVFEKRCPILECKRNHIEMDIVAADSLLRNSILYAKMGELVCLQYLSRLKANLTLKPHLEDYFIRKKGRDSFTPTALDYVIGYQKDICFYCKREFISHDFSSKPRADHFIPWAFVKTSRIENLIFACNECNSSKSDRLAKINYFNKLLHRNMPESDFWVNYPVEIIDKEERIEKWVKNYHQASEQLSTGWSPDKIYA